MSTSSAPCPSSAGLPYEGHPHSLVAASPASVNLANPESHSELPNALRRSNLLSLVADCPEIRCAEASKWLSKASFL